MNPSSEDIKDILESSAVGVGTFATDLFIGKEPDSPNACVTIYDTGGAEPEAGYVYDYPTIQIRIRGEVGGYRNAYLKAKEVRDALHGRINEIWSSTRYIGIWAMSDILFLGIDDKQRPIFTVNFRIHRTT